MDEGKGEYMVKDISHVDSMLPLSLFGREFVDSDILKPVSELTIPRAHLPSPNFDVVQVRSKPRTDRYFSVHAYDHIQEGRAQLLIISPPGAIIPTGKGMGVEEPHYMQCVLLVLALVMYGLAHYLKANGYFSNL